MADPCFFSKSAPRSIDDLAEKSGTTLMRRGSTIEQITDVASLEAADAHAVSFFDNPKYIEQVKRSKAAACFVHPKHVDIAPNHMALLVSDDPYRAYAAAAQYFYPSAAAETALSEHAHIDPTAHIGASVRIDAGATIGAHVQLGDRCHVGAGAILKDHVRIGEDTTIDAGSILSHAHIGDRVTIHRNVNIGQDGFGFALSAHGHRKVPQLGRVIVEDDVEIGAGTCIDRGSGPDTVIGQGTKIDNLVQIGHNVHIGRGCVLVAQVGIAGSTQIGDGVILGGQVGIGGHLTVGAGARIAGGSGVVADVPAGTTYGGYPAVPVTQWHRQSITLHKLVKK